MLYSLVVVLKRFVKNLISSEVLIMFHWFEYTNWFKRYELVVTTIKDFTFCKINTDVVVHSLFTFLNLRYYQT